MKMQLHIFATLLNKKGHVIKLGMETGNEMKRNEPSVNCQYYITIAVPNPHCLH